MSDLKTKYEELTGRPCSSLICVKNLGEYRSTHEYVDWLEDKIERYKADDKVLKGCK